MGMAVVMVLWSLSWSRTDWPAAVCLKCAARLTEPRLQTAISESLVLSVISVHRLELCTTPTCCCGERILQGSLKVIQGWPVSNSMDSILRHSDVAGIFLNKGISRSAENTSELKYQYDHPLPDS